MMKQEFEALAGYEVSFDDYTKIIEPMYMATNLSKEDFVQTINKKRFALKPLKQIIKEMKKCAESLEDSCTHFTDWETRDRLKSLAREYVHRKYPCGIATFGFHDEQKWSCYYPQSLEIYSTSTLKTFESIDLV